MLIKDYGLDVKLEQESLNLEIDNALNEYKSKNGGSGGNRPDAKLLLKSKSGKYYPILIEYKGYKNKLEKLNPKSEVDNWNKNNEPIFENIRDYAVNGAVHYANALLHLTSYTDVIAIGVTGSNNQFGELEPQIGVYYVSKENFGIGQKVGEYSDLSFLKKEHFDEFIDKVKLLSLTEEEIKELQNKREKAIDASLIKLNNDIFKNETGLLEKDRIYLVAATIIATLGIPEEGLSSLSKNDLNSSEEMNERDGDILIRKISNFFDKKKIPNIKKELIIRTLENTLKSERINKPVNGVSQLKRVFIKIVDDLGFYYKTGLTTDFTGKLFNEMYSWLGFTKDKLNDVVLTPSYVATLLAKLAKVNKDSYVWDFATGSGGLLVAARNEMIEDAKRKIKSPEILAQKIISINAEQLLGVELLEEIYMLAVINMILMGDGSSNILNKDSLLDFEGNYEFGKENQKFPATAFILNPPYSASGNGMIFVQKALNLMDKGYASIIIQASAGTGKAKSYNQAILEKHTLLASIKMPIDIFIGKSSVQTYIYVFKVGEPHHKDNIVKFIDFSYDGYTRTNRKKSKINLVDSDKAKQRYQEVVDLVHFGKKKLKIFNEDQYFEGYINPKNGADWNQSKPIKRIPVLKDFKNTVSDFLAWEVSNLIKSENLEDENLKK
ncbi:Restriction enzyme BgcI subunit alpha [Mycoplasmopsis citelli]|uniref:site-specific DNA-methyltransferase (adenine-specific) n=1 Tax=Mycoplasmopsis citelli TaxID=171281 RepID=A0A449B2E2_9BACT|nr:N-6 DNA methylase [Mycoplasmopsis citelli]VEU74762.1 Restriction enzyme BgcI subunit alpha [Mycoplasmopsis citelli]